MSSSDRLKNQVLRTQSMSPTMVWRKLSSLKHQTEIRLGALRMGGELQSVIPQI